MNHIPSGMNADLLSQSGLSLERLRTFCLIAEAGGVTKAAGGDATRQPLFSRQLKELETFFGVVLVRRAGRGVNLTAEGRELHRLVRDYLAALSDFKGACASQPVHLHVGAGDSIIQWLMLPRLNVARTKLRSVRLSFLNLTTQEIIDQVSEGKIELGVVRKDAVSPRLKSLRLGRMDYALYVPKKLIRGAGTKWQDVLSRSPLALLSGSGVFRQQLEQATTKEGLTLRVEVECSTLPSVCKALQCAELASILPTLADAELAAMDMVKVAVPWMSIVTREICLVWSPRAADIRDAISSAASVLGHLWKFS